jgi:hypothetical protein
MAMTRRRAPKPTRQSVIGDAIVAGAVAFALLVVLPRLPFGPSGIHVQWLLAPRLVVCDRTYRGGTEVRSGAELAADQAPIVLVDPGPLGFFPSCPQPDANGNRPCTREAVDGPCATVVYVRVGDDSYAAYELSGGP